MMEMKDYGLELRMGKREQIAHSTMHNEQSSRAKMVVDQFQSEDGRDKTFMAG